VQIQQKFGIKQKILISNVEPVMGKLSGAKIYVYMTDFNRYKNQPVFDISTYTAEQTA
jgi:hypothetical protein